MWEFWIDWTCQNFTANFFELFSFIAEGNDLGWADEGEIKWIEEKDDIFAFVVVDIDFTEISVEPSWSFEVWGMFSDQWHIFLFNL